MASVDIVNTPETTITFPSPLPYAPSWFDNLKSWVETLRMPWWVFYTLLAGALIALELGLQWQAGLQGATLQRPFLFWFSASLVLLLALMHYLDRSAARAIEASRPSLDVNDHEYTVLRYRLTHLPARVTLLWGLGFIVMGVPIFFFLADIFAGYGTFVTPGLEILHLTFFGLTWFINGTLVYHSIHQLRTISQIYTEHAMLNLFDLDPLYAFSGVTGRAAIGLVIFSLGWSSAPEFNANTLGIGIRVAFGVFNFIVFVLPLWGIHQRLVAEKSRRLGNAGKRLETQLALLAESLDKGALEQIPRLKDAVSSLEIERAILAKIPTWPWSADTLRTVLTAIFFPTVVFLIQLLLKQFLP
jgi:hypothetical protein